MQQDTFFALNMKKKKIAVSILIFLLKDVIVTPLSIIVNSWMIGTSNLFSGRPHPQYIGSVPRP